MENLEKYRKNIDEIDKNILELFEKRMVEVKKVIEFKMENNLEILNKNREKEVIESKMKLLKNKEIEEEVEEFFIDLMKVSKKYQEKILKK